MSLNRAMVIGNVGGDPKLRHLPSGQPVVAFSIATDEAYTDKQGQKQERVEWHNIVVFGKLAETCAKYLATGRLSAAGHRGDLPMLVVDSRGDATQAVTAPHLTVEQIRGRSIMIHAGGDNYSDTPAPLGGDGARIACGVIH